MKGRKQDKPFGLHMSFDEALRRFVGASPAEVTKSIADEKEKREPSKRPPPLEDEKPLG